MTDDTRTRLELPLARLASYLSASGLTTDQMDVSLMAGGRSNLTYRLTAETPSGRRVWVLRRPPLGHVLPTAHDMTREFRVISALRASPVPVPAALLRCDDEAVIGAPFYLMEFVEGEVVRSMERLATLGTCDGVGAAFSLVDVLAKLHQIEVEAVGLADLGRPAGFMERQVRRWTKQLEASRSRDLPGIESLADALAAALPVEQTSALIHGDYRLDNCILKNAEVAAVLDWEMATLGDPLADLAMFAMYYGGFADLPNDIVHSPAGIAGFPRTIDLLERYATATGSDVDQFHWYMAFAWFKFAVILEGIHYRSVLGMSAADEFTGVADLVPHAVERGQAALLEHEVPA
jgi:aminoglycoside phosphotransferase (APT) family kinase protein